MTFKGIDSPQTFRIATRLYHQLLKTHTYQNSEEKKTSHSRKPMKKLWLLKTSFSMWAVQRQLYPANRKFPNRYPRGIKPKKSQNGPPSSEFVSEWTGIPIRASGKARFFFILPFEKRFFSFVYSLPKSLPPPHGPILYRYHHHIHHHRPYTSEWGMPLALFRKTWLEEISDFFPSASNVSGGMSCNQFGKSVPRMGKSAGGGWIPVCGIFVWKGVGEKSNGTSKSMMGSCSGKMDKDGVRNSAWDRDNESPLPISGMKRFLEACSE